MQALVGRYDNPIPTRFLAPIDDRLFLNSNTAQKKTVFLNFLRSPGIDSKETIPPAYVACSGPVRQPYYSY